MSRNEQYLIARPTQPNRYPFDIQLLARRANSIFLIMYNLHRDAMAIWGAGCLDNFLFKNENSICRLRMSLYA